MKTAFVAALFALAASAVALPNPKPEGSSYTECHPATYGCVVDEKTGCSGWQVCSAEGQWVFGGNCPPMTQCHFNEKNQSPYCI